MREQSAHNGRVVMSTHATVTHDLLARHRTTGKMYRAAVLLFSVLFLLGILGLVLRISDGVSNTALWGYHAAIFAFMLTTAQAAPLVAIVPRIAKAHWRRPISRAAELFSAVGLLNLLLFIPLLWVLPSLEDKRRTLWFYGDLQVPAHMPQIMSTLALMALVVTGIVLLWVSALPDLAAIRDTSTGRRQRTFSWLAHGWHGTSRQWNIQYHRLGMLGALYFMMVVFVHFLISIDFAMALVPGWIDALFPATQAANALQAATATVLVTMFVLRKWGGYGDYIGLDQFWALGKLMFALSLLWFWFWFSSFIIMWYGAKPNERGVLQLLMIGPYLPIFFAIFVLNFVAPLFLMIWNPLRKSIWGPTGVATLVLIGTLLDRLRIYVGAFSVADQAGQHQLDIVPTTVFPEAPDVFIWVGALSGAILMYMLASRIFPPINIWEQKEMLLYVVHKPFHRAEVRVIGRRD